MFELNHRKYVLVSLVFLLIGILNVIVKAAFYDSDGFITVERSLIPAVIAVDWLFVIVEIIWVVATLIIACKEIKAVLAEIKNKSKSVVVKKVVSKKKRAKK